MSIFRVVFVLCHMAVRVPIRFYATCVFILVIESRSWLQLNASSIVLCQDDCVLNRVYCVNTVHYVLHSQTPMRSWIMIHESELLYRNDCMHNVVLRQSSEPNEWILHCWMVDLTNVMRLDFMWWSYAVTEIQLQHFYWKIALSLSLSLSLPLSDTCVIFITSIVYKYPSFILVFIKFVRTLSICVCFP